MQRFRGSIDKLRFGWRWVVLLALVLLGVLWIVDFDRCLYAPDARNTAIGCFISGVLGLFAGLYLAAVAAFFWLLSLMGGR
jgi:hypothetical protein